MRRPLFGITALVAVSTILPGCAVVSDYWRKPTKYKQMPEVAGDMPPVATLSLDASRRLVISQQINNSRDPRFTCPEPPPDVALSTLSQTLVSLQSKTGNSAELSDAYVAIAQALSTRTSTVEIWRTTSSTFCILLMNNKVPEAFAYLAAARTSIATTKDTLAATPPSTMQWPSLHAEAAAFRKYADEKAAEAKAAAEAAAKKEKDAQGETASEPEPPAASDAEAKKKAEELAVAKKTCDALPAEQKADNADCKKVAEAEQADTE